MCTLLVAANVISGHPLVVVANRDEQLDRPSSPPLLWPGGFLAPRDDQAGGTWLGINAHGVFVGVMNRYLGPREPTRRSRGDLVTEALALASARAIHEAMATVPATRHNGFHLVYADTREVLATLSDGETLAQVALGDGLHALSERSFCAGDDRARRAHIERSWSRAQAATFEPAALISVLAEHDPADPLSSTCIHLDSLRYGTRSAMILALSADPSASQMLWAEGPPCTTPFAPVTELTSLLRAVPAPAERR
jgi:uncharacterized protein with NRDE domain